MVKIRIIALQSRKYKIIRELHNLGVMDLRKSKLEIANDESMPNLPEMSEQLVRFRGAESLLKRYLKKKELAKMSSDRRELEPETLMREAKGLKIMPRTFALDERRAALLSERKEIREALKIADIFVGTDINFSKLKSERLGFAAYMVSRSARRTVAGITQGMKKGYEILSWEKKRGNVLLFIAYDKRNENALESLAKVSGIYEIDIANHNLHGTAYEAVHGLEEMEEEVVLGLRHVRHSLRAIARHEYLKIAEITEMLEIEVDRATVSLDFKRTNATFVVEGWVQERMFKETVKRIKNVSDRKVIVEELKDGELAPTLLNRTGILHSFDYLVSFISLPRSDEIDPTWIFIMMFPIFYGLMVADVGYGIVSFIFASIIAMKTKPDGLVYHTARIWQLSAISIIFFGFLSNQYFGYQLNGFLALPTPLQWLSNITMIILLTIILGIVQVEIGLIFGFVNQYRHKHMKLALSKITSMIFVVSGAIAVGGGFFAAFSPVITSVSTGIALVSLVITVAISGIEAAEVVSLISHPLSYIRILGFGLASIIIALMIDKAFTPALSSGLLSFALTLVVFSLLHFMNMTLGIFEGAIQGVRLNFVEFFSKFYEGNGVKFTPFYYKRNYTKER